MKNLKFRGISLGTGNMIYGFGVLATSDFGGQLQSSFIYAKTGTPTKVNPATVGQFTGIIDGKGREIYDGDILEDDKLRYVVEWNQQNTKFCINPITTAKGDEAFVLIAINYNQLGNGYFKRDDLAVAGNIHENPELLQP